MELQHPNHSSEKWFMIPAPPPTLPGKALASKDPPFFFFFYKRADSWFCSNSHKQLWRLSVDLRWGDGFSRGGMDRAILLPWTAGPWLGIKREPQPPDTCCSSCSGPITASMNYHCDRQLCGPEGFNTVANYKESANNYTPKIYFAWVKCTSLPPWKSWPGTTWWEPQWNCPHLAAAPQKHMTSTSEEVLLYGRGQVNGGCGCVEAWPVEWGCGCVGVARIMGVWLACDPHPELTHNKLSLVFHMFCTQRKHHDLQN